MQPFEHPNRNENLKRSQRYYDDDKLDKFQFYGADTSNRNIIAYGDVNGKKQFKIVYKKEKYTCYKKQGRKYNQIGVCDSLESSISYCEDFMAMFRNK